MVEAGGRRRFQQRFGGGSYQSAGDSRLHFGLSQSTRIEQVEVRGGRRDKLTGMKGAWKRIVDICSAMGF